MRLITFSIVIVGCLAQDLGPSVDVTFSAGTVRGFKVDHGSNTSQLWHGKADIFLGIPYAQPPVGNLRFQKPIPYGNFSANLLNATIYKPSCPQPQEDFMSEDCLYLNVFSPDVKSTVKYPVMLWIHGGFLRVGGAKDVPYKGAVRNLVSRGVVVVVIQYRLGMLGFFTTFSEDFPPNLGMLDQAEAIKWTKDNIFAFGGDPYKITLFGESAGAGSVSAHTYSPLTQNLFQAAIMESSTVLTFFDGALGYTDMRQRKAQQDPRDQIGWKIVQDDYFLPDIPSNLAAKRPNIPVMIGSNKDEWAGFELDYLATSGDSINTFNKSRFEAYMQFRCGYLLNEDSRITTMFENVYCPPGTPDNNNGEEWIKINNDAFTCVVITGFVGREVQNYLNNNNSQVYLYEYTYYSPVSSSILHYQVLGWYPIVHMAEVPIIWAIEDLWEGALNETTETDFAMLDWFGKTWTDFAKLGIPNTPIRWDPVEDFSLQYYQIDDKTPGMKREYRKKDNVLWNQVIPVLAGQWPPVLNSSSNKPPNATRSIMNASI